MNVYEKLPWEWKDYIQGLVNCIFPFFVLIHSHSLNWCALLLFSLNSLSLPLKLCSVCIISTADKVDSLENGEKKSLNLQSIFSRTSILKFLHFTSRFLQDEMKCGVWRKCWKCENRRTRLRHFAHSWIFCTPKLSLSLLPVPSIMWTCNFHFHCRVYDGRELTNITFYIFSECREWVTRLTDYGVYSCDSHSIYCIWAAHDVRLPRLLMPFFGTSNVYSFTLPSHGPRADSPLSHIIVYVHQNEYNAVYNITDYFSWIFNFTMKASNQHKLSLKFTSLSLVAVAAFFTQFQRWFLMAKRPRALRVWWSMFVLRQKKTRRISHFTHAWRLSNQRALHQPFAVLLLWQQTSVVRTEHLPEFK